MIDSWFFLFFLDLELLICWRFFYILFSFYGMYHKNYSRFRRCLKRPFQNTFHFRDYLVKKLIIESRFFLFLLVLWLFKLKFFFNICSSFYRMYYKNESRFFLFLLVLLSLICWIFSYPFPIFFFGMYHYNDSIFRRLWKHHSKHCSWYIP